MHAVQDVICVHFKQQYTLMHADLDVESVQLCPKKKKKKDFLCVCVCAYVCVCACMHAYVYMFTCV